MEPTTQAVPGYFVWQAPGQALAIHLHLGMIDRLAADIMRGFSALPKRGAEVGGVLLGSIDTGDAETGDVTIVRIENFESIPCHYKRGPSYLFTEDSQPAFDQACARRPLGNSNGTCVVGYYRSHTREGPLMAPEDIELLDRCFPLPAQVALLVKPFATRAGLASLFVRENGRFPEIAPMDFPFRRRDLDPGRASEPEPVLLEQGSSDFPLATSRMQATTDRTQTKRKSRQFDIPAWIWIPMSFVFLILGLFLGNLLTRSSSDREAFYLGLSVTRTGENLTVHWNRDAPGVRAAQNGRLEIEDGGYTKPVELDPAHLQGGSLIYRNSSNHVRFRLIVFLNSRSDVTETLDWQQ